MKFKQIFLLGFVAVFAYTFFTTPSPKTTQNASKPLPADFNAGLVCRAAISVVMYTDFDIIKADSVENDIAHVHYNRTSDNKLWKNKCKFTSDRVVWAADDIPDPRWRDLKEDGYITYKIDGQSLSVTEHYPDGSSNTKGFSYQPSKT